MATVCKSFVCEDLGVHMFKEKIVMIHISKILFQILKSKSDLSKYFISVNRSEDEERRKKAFFLINETKKKVCDFNPCKCENGE